MVPKIWKITKIYITRYRFLRVWYRNGTVNLRGFWGKMSPLQRGEKGRRTCVLRPSFGLWCQVKPVRSKYPIIFVRSQKWSYREQLEREIKGYMQHSRFQRFEISHPMRYSQEHPLHFTETKTTTPNRTKSLGIVHTVHGLQKRGRV